MGRTILSLFTAICVISGTSCYSQPPVKISDPRLEIRGNTLLISYDILNSDPEDKYIISIDIKDANGNTLKANSLEGDIGMVEKGGINKHITWDPEADNVFINSKIYVKVQADIVIPPKPIETQPEETTSENQIKSDALPEAHSPAVSNVNARSYSRTGIVIQSLALPGLGLARMTGKPHWLRGVAGYGCLAGSVILNRVALNTYKGIGDLVEYEDKNDLYQKASGQNSISQALAFTAAGIWIADIVWTWVGTTDIKRNSPLSQSRGVSFGGNIDPLSYIPMVNFRYLF
jgi:hypothetical protein